MIIDRYFKKIAIIGVGLLGGSIGLALKERSFKGFITGIGKEERILRKAAAAGVIDDFSFSVKKAVYADLILICTPVGIIADIYKQVYPFLNNGTIVTDVGSTKQKILKDIAKIEKGKKCFIGSHPMAGSEKSGFEAGSSGLFNDSLVAVIKEKNTPENNLKKINSFWKCIGAKVVNLSSKEHDEIVAQTSHMPHIISCLTAYSCMEGDKNGNNFKNIFGNGLLDITRLSQSDPDIWIDIFSSNKNNILDVLNNFKQNIALFEKLLKNNEYNRIKKILKSGKAFRKKLLRKK